MKKICFAVLALSCLAACSVSKKVAVLPQNFLLQDSAMSNAHIGIYVYNPATKKVVANYQSDKYFVPASNTKLLSCFAAMKYLGDSLEGIRYAMLNDNTMMVQPTGDPSFFHSDFKNNPVYDFLLTAKKRLKIDASNWKEAAHGRGWAWNDFDELYMTERSPMPIYENAMAVTITNYEQPNTAANFLQNAANNVLLSFPKLEISYQIKADTLLRKTEVKRDFSANRFLISLPAKPVSYKASFPFVTNGIEAAKQIFSKNFPALFLDTSTSLPVSKLAYKTIYSQPTDSVLKPMMHQSDNFFAEQILLMVSNKQLGYMNDHDVIDFLLKNDLQDLPQKPVWVDGSGLSRYNLFTPQDFVKLLEKMKDAFGMERIKNLLPTGGEGTLSSLYKPIANSIFAKTGTLSGQVALSGYLYTKANALLLFSILVNNHNSSAALVRKAVEKFVMYVWATN